MDFLSAKRGMDCCSGGWVLICGVAFRLGNLHGRAYQSSSPAYRANDAGLGWRQEEAGPCALCLALHSGCGRV